MSKEHLKLRLGNALGDSVVMTAAVRDLAMQYGDRFEISVKTNFPEVWKNNPHIVLERSDGRVVPMNYREEQGLAYREQTHFLQAFHRILNKQLGIRVALSRPKPDLHTTPEDAHPTVQKPYWVIFPGWKNDMPAKAWPTPRWQQLVDILEQWGIHCVQTGSTKPDCHNPLIAGAENATYPSNVRQLFHLISEAEGVICGITSGMHIAAAFDRPCIVLAGGREPWWWEAYVNQNPGFGPASGLVQVPHRFLHTQGQLSCCLHTGCGRTKVTHDQIKKSPAEVCLQTVRRHGRPLPACMDPLTPEIVADAVLSYYLDGTLAPHSSPLKEFALKATLPPVGQTLQIKRPDGLVTEISTLRPVLILPTAVTDEAPPARSKPSQHPVWSDPNIGNRVTICVLTYGDYHELHRTCLDSLLSTTSREQVELRVGGNQLCKSTENYLQLLQDRGDVQHLNLSPENRCKYPVMRQMFRDPPLTTNWVIWLDDDTLCDRDDDWLVKMLAAAAREFPDNGRWAGPHFRYRLQANWDKWCREGTWYRGKPWPIIGGIPRIGFATGSLWAAHVPTLLAADVPDARLVHNKGDVTIGCQFHQAGVKLIGFSTKKDVVNWSSSARRGVTEVHQAERLRPCPVH